MASSQHNRPALLVVAHGSTERAEDNRPLIELGERLGIAPDFEQVNVGFIKAEPEASALLEALDASEVVVVPLLMSEGYFYARVLPRELGLDSNDPSQVQARLGKRVVYAHAVGTHPDMPQLVLGRVDQARRAFDELPARPHLLLVGHGTTRHAESGTTTQAAADELDESDAFAAVSVAYLDESPYLDDQLERLAAQELVVVPYFIGEGLHTRKDIPEAIGLPEYTGRPARLRRSGRTIWYTPPVGTHPRIADLILAQARQASQAFSRADD